MSSEHSRHSTHAARARGHLVGGLGGGHGAGAQPVSAEAGEAGRGRGDDEGEAAQRRHHPRPAQTGQLCPRPAPALQLRHGQPLHQRAPGQGTVGKKWGYKDKVSK